MKILYKKAISVSAFHSLKILHVLGTGSTANKNSPKGNQEKRWSMSVVPTKRGFISKYKYTKHNSNPPTTMNNLVSLND